MESNPIVALVVAVLLVALTVRIARRQALRDGDSLISILMVASLLLRFVSAIMQIYIVKHVYHGIADFTGYETHGAVFATGLRHGHFDLGTKLIGNGMPTMVVGFVYFVTGANQLAGFFVFAWIALMGMIFFYRAVGVALPQANHLRYLVLVLFLPSLLYWPSETGKDALVIVGIGAGTIGAARLLTRQRGFLLPLVLGLGFAALVRPHEALVLIGGLGVALLIKRPTQRSYLTPLRWLATLAAVAAGVGLMALLTSKFLSSSGYGSGSLTSTLNSLHENNQGSGAGFGSSSVAWSANPIYYPRDIYTVLFDPLPIRAHGVTQLLASAENSVLTVILLLSLPRLIESLRLLRTEPFVCVALIYTAGLLYIFASLGNLGLIDRQRTALLPMMMVLVCLPPSTARRHAPADSLRQGRPPWVRKPRATGGAIDLLG